MSLPLLSVLIFLVTLALVISALYFFVEAPAAKKKLRERLESAKQLLSQESSDGEAIIMRSEILSGIPFLNRLLLQTPGMARLNLFIQQSALSITAGMLLTLSLLTGWLVFMLFLFFEASLFPALLVGGLCALIPFMVVGINRQRRFLKFEEQFPDALDLLSRAVRAGHAFTSGLDLIARELPSPVSDEFKRTWEQQNMGLPLRDALQNMARRMPLIDLQLFVTTLSIQRDTGGNLAEILDNLAHVIRERFKVMRQARVYTAQGRLSLYVLIALPPLTGLLVFLLNPDYVMILFTDPLGIQLLAVGTVLQVAGYFVIRKIIQPKI